jgi:hypothetical protein
MRERECDLVLNGEDVIDVSIESVGPDMLAGRGINELHRYVDAIRRLMNAALEHVVHTELARDLAHIRCAPL